MRDRFHRCRVFIFFVVLCFLGAGYVYLHMLGLGGRHMVTGLRYLIIHAGVWGPFLIVLVFALQTLVPVPNIVLAIMTGALYGPFLGSLVVMMGLLTSAMVSFYAGRYVGQTWVEEHAPVWARRYRDLLEQQGFSMVLCMRLLQFPSDIVGVLCGITRLPLRTYLISTFFGMLPVAITFTVLGRSSVSPRASLLFVSLFLGSIGLAFLVKKLRWVSM